MKFLPSLYRNVYHKVTRMIRASTSTYVLGALMLIWGGVAPAGAVSATESANNFKNFIDSLTSGVVASLGYFFMGCAVVAFIFGIFSYILAMRNGEQKQITEGKQFMLWGIVALFVMFSMYGIIRFMQGTLGVGGGGRLEVGVVGGGGVGGTVPGGVVGGTVPGGVVGGTVPGGTGGVVPGGVTGGAVPGGTTGGTVTGGSVNYGFPSGYACSDDANCGSGKCSVSIDGLNKTCQ